MNLSVVIDNAGPHGIVHLASGNCRPGVRSRATALPCSMSRIDRISIDGGLEKLERSDAVALLRECRRILVPDGRLRVVTRSVDAGRPPGRIHDCRWTALEDELRELGSQVGLKVVHAGHSIVEFTKQLPSLSKQSPLVSVLIPAFKPQFVAEAMESVLAQTYGNLELVICDDCPTSEIQDIVERYAAGDPRIRYVRNESTLGSRQNHIRCLRAASGELIKFLSDDDRLHPTCLERLVACLIEFPDVTLVTSRRQCIDKSGRHLADLDATVRPVRQDSRIDGAALARAVLLLRLNMIGEPSTTMFRKSDLVDTTPDLFSFGGRRYETIGDVVMWLNLLGKGDAIYLTQTLSYFRLHPDQEQRSEHVRATSLDSWMRMRVDAVRMGLIPDDAPVQLPWTPLAAADDAAGQLRQEHSDVERDMAASVLDGGLDHWPAVNQLVGGLVDVLGWAESELPKTVEVQVLVDGCTWPAWVRWLGPDIPPPVSSLASKPLISFCLTVDTRSIPDGRHVLTFLALSGGKTLILGQRLVVIRNRELLGVGDGPAGELVEHLACERDALRVDLKARLNDLADLARAREAERLELETRLDMLANERDAIAGDLRSRIEQLVSERDAAARERDEAARERDEAAAHVGRMLHAWPVRLYGRAVRLPGAATLVRRIAGVRH